MRPAGLLRHPHGRPRTIPGARLWCRLVALMALISPARANPFARHIVPSAAGPRPDCDIGSGDRSQPTGFWEGIRFGEATHPGPYEEVILTCSNPGGIRNKEDLVLSLGPGIHCFSETQLSHVTQPQFGRALRWRASDYSRAVQTHFGHPALYAPNLPGQDPGLGWLR